MDGLGHWPEPRGDQPHLDAFRLPPHRRQTFKLVRTHQGLGQLHRRPRWVEFRTFLDAIDTAVPAELAVHLVMAKYGTHKTPLIRRWLAKRRAGIALHADVANHWDRTKV